MRKLFTAIATLAACLIFAMSSYAGTWILDNVGWWWQNNDGSWPASRWEWIDGNCDGLAECYYFDNHGYCVLSGVTPDGYYVNSSGAWVENGVVQLRYMRGYSRTTTSYSGSGRSGLGSATAASASGSVSGYNDVSGGTSILQLNEGDTMIRSLSISGKTLTLKGIPAGSQFNYVWFTLEDATGERVYDEILCRRGRNLSFDLSDVSPGTYMVCVYVNSEQYSPYRAVLYREIYLTVAGTGMSLSGDSAIAVNAANRRYSADSAELSRYLSPSGSVQSDDASIRQLAQQITASGGSDYEKAKNIHRWVADNIFYDLDASSGRTPIGECSALEVYQTGLSVCAGYSNLTAALFRACGIPAKVVYGYSIDAKIEDWPASEFYANPANLTHAWNEAYVDGRWIIIDVTWDSGNKWEYGHATSGDGCLYNRYFDIAMDLFSLTHAITEYPWK